MGFPAMYTWLLGKTSSDKLKVQKEAAVQDWAKIMADIYKMEKMIFIIKININQFVKH